MTHLITTIFSLWHSLPTPYRRVPPSQGVEFYYALKGHGVDTRMLMYENNGHGLPELEASSDAYINIALWLDKYISPLLLSK